MKIYLFVVMVLSSALLYGQKDDLTHRIDSLSYFAERYPPNIKDSLQFQQVIQLYESVINDLLLLQSEKSNDAEFELTLGRAFHMGHNLDVRKSYSNSEKHLKRALSLKPDDWRMHQELGLLYVNSQLELAPKAEKLFMEAIELSGKSPSPFLYHNLAFAYYYQGKMKEAYQSFNIYLKFVPDDESVIRVVNSIKIKLKQ